MKLLVHYISHGHSRRLTPATSALSIDRLGPPGDRVQLPHTRPRMTAALQDTDYSMSAISNRKARKVNLQICSFAIYICGWLQLLALLARLSKDRPV